MPPTVVALASPFFKDSVCFFLKIAFAQVLSLANFDSLPSAPMTLFKDSVVLPAALPRCSVILFACSA